jgi:uncharacterized protein YndB with AHSA1/START domain
MRKPELRKNKQTRSQSSMPEVITEQHVLELKRTYPHPPGRVYEAFTQPEQLLKWFGPEGYETVEAEVDLRNGGRYRIAMRKLPDGDPFHVEGVYREIVPGQRLQFSWQWSGTNDAGIETLVTMEFHERDGGTELVLQHERFPALDMRDRHIKGWSSVLDRLAGHCHTFPQRGAQ